VLADPRVIGEGVENTVSYIDTENGRLYSKADAEKVNLRPRSKPRPDVKERATTAFKEKGAYGAEQEK